MALSAFLGIGVTQQAACANSTVQVEPSLSGSETEEAPPSLEFLEFLGQWETDEGEWIAPEDLADENFVDLIESALTDSALTDSALETGLDTDDLN